MFLTAIRIYGLTNLLFLTVIAISWFPEGVGLAFFASFFSLMFTAPLIFLLALVLWILNRSKFSPTVCWMLFLAAVGAMVYLPFYWFGLGFGTGEMEPFTYCAYAGAFISILILRKPIHRLFTPAQNSQQETETESLPIEPVQPLQTNNYN
jgi:hypothetical protein